MFHCIIGAEKQALLHLPAPHFPPLLHLGDHRNLYYFLSLASIASAAAAGHVFSHVNYEILRSREGIQ